MATIKIDEETKERLKKVISEEQDDNKILNMLMDSYEEMDEEYVEKQREKLERDKANFITLEDYKKQRDFSLKRVIYGY